ncbi:LacI family DNA-binding transcriptional regulator [Flavilitoribacter nigricans]|uniref:HTH lacI-type domain-containing protein n=1 Tax=Flavilitoribacter nigricans (strain ATCC 23147 / DSM 23189 / NBRC 102662 / NCIMB 1420 / SS-2) TaxID=1122177 RepID=A0A2D0NB74_FLAN2|nr:LacI family DNA-binding transcriptional regulator [Flavilitoribacter nigricans]PHN05761.1 hypothetical protein CRP01_14900 [Flavilitoribacter nigricans DSM 23189 = NBRC 102662]
MGRITVKDIARLLNINPSTVSRALKDHPDISKETIEKVKQVAEELGYEPNLQAISFRNRKSRLIGLIIPDMNMYFFPSVIKAIEDRVRAEGYNLLVLHSNNSLRGEQNNTKICDRLGVEGLLVSVSAESENLSHFEELTERGVPVVLFDRIVDRRDFPIVCIDDVQVAGKVVKHLYDRGFRKICGAFDDPHLSISKRRRQGYEKMLQDLGLEVKPEWIFHADSSETAGEKMAEVLDLPDQPDAIFSMSDQLLVGIMQACLAKGVEIPGEMAIACISNGLVPNFWKPHITYMHHSGEEVGAIAANVLFNMIRNNPVPHMNWVETNMVVQSST